MDTITFSCYSCGQVLKVGAGTAGKKAKCVKCATILTIPMADASPAATPAPTPSPPARREEIEEDRGPRPQRRSDFDFDEEEERPRKRRRDEDDDEPRRRSRDDDEDDYDRPRKRRRDDEQDAYDRPKKKWGDWNKVRVGMTLQAVCGGVLAGTSGLGAIALLLCLVGLMPNQPIMGLLKTGAIIGAIGLILFFLVAIAATVGYVFCLFSPNKRGAMIWAIVVLSVGGVSLISRIVWALIPAINCFSSFSSRGDGVAQGLGVLISVTHIPIVLVGGGDPFGGPPSVAGTIIVSILVVLVMFAEYVLFPIYMMRAGMALKDRYLSSAAMLPLILAASGMGLKVLTLILFGASSGSVTGEAAGKTMLIITGVLALLAHGAMLTYGILALRLSMSAKHALAG
jgi:hypothetical protein